jgi:Putative Actinobacterial Holin-X, holin superfamily III
MDPTEGPARKTSTAELLKELGAEVSTLVRQEVQLAKAELVVKGREFGAGGAMFGVAAVASLAALGAVVTCCILALAILLPAWGAALVTAAAFGLVAGVAALAGRRKVKRGAPPVPEEAVESVKEDVRWAKSRLRSVRR